MSLINDTDFLIHNLRLSYLRDVEDPYGPRIISLSPSYTSNPYILTSGLADADRWPELDVTSSPTISEDEQERPLGFPGARLKHTQTIMGRRTGGLGLRVSGKRASTSKRMSVASVGTPRQTDVQNFITGNAPVGGLPASAPTTAASDEPTPPPEPEPSGPAAPNDDDDDQPPEPPPKLQPPQVQIQEPSVVQDVPVTKTVMFIPKFKNAAEMEARRRLRMAARRRGPGGGPAPAPQPLSFDTTSEEEAGHLNPDSSDEDSDFGGGVTADGSMDEFDPEFPDTRPNMNSDSDIASVVSDISNSLPSIANSSAPYSVTRPRLISNASSSQQAQRVAGPRKPNPSSLPRSNPQPTSAKQPVSPAPTSASATSTSAPIAGLSQAPTSNISFTRRLVPSLPSSTKSALSTMLASSSSSPNPFAETYASISGRGVAPAQRVSIQVFFPRATGIKDGGRDGGRSKVREGMELSVRKDATVEEVIGFALWTYWEEGWLPPLDHGLPKGGEEAEEEERRVRLSAVGWILRITEDDGEIDDDFPPPDRSGKISKFNADGFAVLEANAAQIAQNKLLESKLASTRPALAKATSEKSNMLVPTAVGAAGTVLTPTGQSSALASSLIGSAPLSTSLGPNAGQGPQMFLRIRIADNADAVHVSTTIPVSSGMYMQEVLDTVCRKPMLGLGNPGDYALLVSKHRVYIPLDRTVASLQGERELLLVKRSMLPSMGVDVMKAGKTTDPNASIFKRNSETPEVKLSSTLDFTAAYKKYTIYRKLPMLVARQEKTLAIDGGYVHIMPSTNNAAKAKAVFETGRTSSYHIKSIVDCQQSPKSPHIFKLVLNRVDRSGSNKRYYFEAETPKLAGEIVQTVKAMKAQFERSSMLIKSRRSTRAAG